MRLADGRPIAPDIAAIRQIARVMLEQGESRGLLAFGTADDHLHAELATHRAAAGNFARYVEITLGRRLALGVPFETARIRPLHDQHHAYNTFHYVHRQDVRHELDRDPSREGTSLPDLVGLRVLAASTSIGHRVRAHLPRVRRAELVSQFPASALEDDRPIELDVLAAAAAAAFALPDLRGRCADASRARRAAAHVAGPDVPTKLLGECLGVKTRAVQRLRATPREPVAIRAVHMQALLRTPTKKQLPDVA